MNFLSYQNDKYGFQIDYPDSWELVNNHPLAAIVIIGPLVKSTKYQPEVFVNIFETENIPKNFEEFKEITPQQLSPLMDDFKVHKFSKYSLSGQNSYLCIYSGKSKFGRLKGVHLKYMQISTNVDKTYYQISYSHGLDYFDKFMDIFEKILKSFTILLIGKEK